MSPPKLWGGVFGKDTNQVAWGFGQSIHSDLTLFREEIEVSVAHAKMLGSCGIISDSEQYELEKALESILQSYETGTLEIDFGAEDIHGFIESLLVKALGDVAKKLHSGRSRNDQIATVTRLWLRNKCQEINGQLLRSMSAILNLADQWKAQLSPGFTHQQHAMPITLGHQLMAYFWMLNRDQERFCDASQRANFCPLGSAAIGGTSLPINRKLTSDSLGFCDPTPNSLDAISDRDFVGDALHNCATLMQHLSRISQDIILFGMAEMCYLQLDDSLSTGSSLMPQKRNPDFAELIRGRAGRAIGNWTAFMSMMKGLQVGYNRDQQEDKPPLFDSIKLCQESLELTLAMLTSATFNAKKLADSAGQGYSNATSICESLVKLGVPFRDAHEIVGGLVRTAITKKVPLNGLEPSDLPPGLPMGLFDLIRQSTAESALSGMESEGGPGPNSIDIQIAKAKDLIHSKLDSK